MPCLNCISSLIPINCRFVFVLYGRYRRNGERARARFCVFVHCAVLVLITFDYLIRWIVAELICYCVVAAAFCSSFVLSLQCFFLYFIEKIMYFKSAHFNVFLISAYDFGIELQIEHRIATHNCRRYENRYVIKVRTSSSINRLCYNRSHVTHNYFFNGIIFFEMEFLLLFFFSHSVVISKEFDIFFRIFHR